MDQPGLATGAAVLEPFLAAVGPPPTRNPAEGVVPQVDATSRRTLDCNQEATLVVAISFGRPPIDSGLYQAIPHVAVLHA